jgi:hypothetical protein
VLMVWKSRAAYCTAVLAHCGKRFDAQMASACGAAARSGGNDEAPQHADDQEI